MTYERFVAFIPIVSFSDVTEKLGHSLKLAQNRLDRDDSLCTPKFTIRTVHY